MLRLRLVLALLTAVALCAVAVTVAVQPAPPPPERVVLVHAQVPKVLRFMTRKCPKITSNGCYWRDTDGEAPNLSFYAVPFPGARKCIVYWYKPGYRFCTTADAKAPQTEDEAGITG